MVVPTVLRVVLRDLVFSSLDCCESFRDLANQIHSVHLHDLLSDLADVRERHAEQFRGLVQWSIDPASERATWQLGVDREPYALSRWVAVDDESAVLVECERIESALCIGYESAIKEVANLAVTKVLLAAYGQVQHHHERIRVMRDILDHERNESRCTATCCAMMCCTG